jgi:hypothetical protein
MYTLHNSCKIIPQNIVLSKLRKYALSLAADGFGISESPIKNMGERQGTANIQTNPRRVGQT